MGRQIPAILLAVLVFPVVRQVRAEVTSQQVLQAIERAQRYLLAQQRPDGAWAEMGAFPGGVSGLCTLALLQSGLPPDHPAVAKALDYLRTVDHKEQTYSVSLITMALCAAEPAKDRALISSNVRTLESLQIREGPGRGSWSYGAETAVLLGDNSNSQFALLALDEAQRAGVPVQEATWRLAYAYWSDQQMNDGAWRYKKEPIWPRTGSMTCAGISSLIIASGQIGQSDASVEGDQVRCCGQQADPAQSAVEKGLAWLADHFTVRSNPRVGTDDQAFGATGYHMYYLYGLERVGRLTGRRLIGQRDWYREGADYLVAAQNPLDGSWTSTDDQLNPTISTAMGLLFLSKGRRPVLVSKLQYGDSHEWNYHRHDLAYLTSFVERQWDQELTWQTISARNATLADLLQTPVLFISGRDSLPLSPAEKELLRQYVEQGGFVFAEACCDGEGFDQAFRALMLELFPDSPLRPLPPDHPAWFAQMPVAPDQIRPLWGLDACCRTSVIYCPEDLTCYWELAGNRQASQYPAAIQKSIQGALALGTNVLTYATNRQLREKLDVPQIRGPSDEPELPRRAMLRLAKLDHAGGSDDAPRALETVLQVLSQQTLLPVASSSPLIDPADASLADYPIVFFQGRRGFQLSATQREGLRRYILSGGFLWGDAICGSESFAQAFRREMDAIFPEYTWEPIPPDHPMFTPEYSGADVRQVTLREPQPRGDEGSRLVARTRRVPPRLEGLRVDDRYVIVFSPLDLSCALQNQTTLQCTGYAPEDAARLALNIVLYGSHP